MNRRGQSTVELAIGTALFVSLLIAGLHLAEVSYLSLKVQEASSAAIWEATGQRIHTFEDPSGGVYAPYGAAPLNAQLRTQNRYRNFDAVLWRSSPQRLFTSGSRLQVTCAPGNAGTLGFAVPNIGTSGAGALLGKWYQDKGQVECAASATATALQMPTAFATAAQGGFNRQQLGSTAPIQLCGVGSALGFGCPGRNSVLLGDWSLDGPPGDTLNHQHPLSALQPQEGSYVFADQDQCAASGSRFNWQYCSMVKEMFERTGSAYNAGAPAWPLSPASEFASVVGGRIPQSIYAGAPYNEKKFSMSFVGVEGDQTGFDPPIGFMGYVDQVRPYLARTAGNYNPTLCNSCHFNTAGTASVEANPAPPTHNDYRLLRSNCFLGLNTSGCVPQTGTPGTPNWPQ